MVSFSYLCKYIHAGHKETDTFLPKTLKVSRIMKHFTIFTLCAGALFALMLTSSCKSSTTKTAAAEKNDSTSEVASAETNLVIDSVKYIKESKDSTISCKIIVDYPTQSDSLSLSIRKWLNEKLNGLFISGVSGEEEGKKHSKYAGNLDKGTGMLSYYGNEAYLELKKNQDEINAYNEDSSPQMSIDLAIRKTDETSKYVTYSCSSYSFMGGAHGSSFETSTNIDKSTGKALEKTIDKTQLKALQPLLRKGVLSYFKQQDENTEVTDKNLEDYLFIEKGIIPLPKQAPYLAKDGVHFIYQQYEIGPYAMGMVTFTIPYAEIKPYLTPDALKLIGE